ncbi:MAG: hypothetical protein OXK16_03795 [bacterium]|nr:hypothetical protein [bacterium]
MTTNRNLRLWIAVLLLGVFALAAIAAWDLFLRPADVAQPVQPTTAGVTPATTRLEAADLAATTITTPAATTGSAVPPTTTTASTTTTTSTTPTTTTTAVELVEDEGWHTHQDGEVHTHDHAPPPTFVVDTSGEGCPYGTYTDRHRVPDQCVLDRLQEIFSAVLAGTHAERMAAIRDGNDLGPVFAGLEAFVDEKYPDYFNGWRDADLRAWFTVTVEGAMWQGPERLGVRWRIAREDLDPVAERWYLAPAVWVDGQWWVSRSAFCRAMVSRMEGGTASPSCPPDPRPGIPAEEEIRAGGIAVYDPEDLPGAERIKVSGGADIW